MNKFILKFSDFILNENNKSFNNTTYFALNESDDLDKSTITKFMDYATKRLKDKVLFHITENDADANLIVSKSNNLIDAAGKVFMNSNEGNWFTKNIYTIAAGGLTILGIITLLKGKRLKLGRFEEELTKIKLEKFISDKKNLSTSFKSDLTPGFQEFSKQLKSVEAKLILHAESLTKDQMHQASRVFREPLDYFSSKYKSILNTYGRMIKNIESNLDVTKSDNWDRLSKHNLNELKSELEIMKGELNWNFIDGKIPKDFNINLPNSKTENWQKIDYLDTILKDEFLRNGKNVDSSPNFGVVSPKQYFNDIKGVVNDFTDILYPKLSNATENLIKKINELLIKVEDQKLPDISSELLSVLTEKSRNNGLEYAISKIEYKQLNSLLPEVYTTTGALSTIGASILYITRLLTTDLFKDIPEIQPVINIINNNKNSKEFYASKIMETSGSNQTLDLNLDYTKFKGKPNKENLAVFLSYYLADIILEYMKYISSMQVYSQLVPKKEIN
jgi:hypothetical protein